MSITVKRSVLTEKLIYLDGKPFSFDGYQPFVGIYDCGKPVIVLMLARQVGKTTSLTNFLLMGGVSVPQFKSLYVSPSKEQTSRFSNTRFAKALFFSPLIKKHFVSNEMPANNVTLRMLANGSEFFFSYAQDEAERIRGISADLLCLDEVQSIDLGTVEPVIRECLAASNHKHRMYCGTPMSAENDIELMLWQKSTKNEWAVQCKHCGTHNILGLKNIGPRFLICARCEKDIDVRYGQWVMTNPTGHITGFRLPQIALHRNVATPLAYNAILEKLRDYSKSRFNNEVLAISDSQGARIISLDMLKALCKGYSFEGMIPNPEMMHGVTDIVAGVDWGGQSPTNVSRTALAILGILADGRLRLLCGKVFPAGHAVQDLEEVARLCTLFRVRLLIGDSGEGMLANAELRHRLGDHVVYGNRYGGTDAKIRYNNNPHDHGYHSDKTMMVDQVMHGIAAKQWEFPIYPAFQPFTDDILAEYEETTSHGRRVWKHAASRPDDFLHAMVFGWLAAMVITGKVVMYQASTEDTSASG